MSVLISSLGLILASALPSISVSSLTANVPKQTNQAEHASDPRGRQVSATHLEHLVRAAWRKAGLARFRSERWRRRARAAAALPVLSVGYDHRIDEGWDLRATYEIPDVLDTDAATTKTLRVRATWELSRAVFTDDELRVVQSHLDIVSERDRIRREVVELYERRASLLSRWNALAPADPQRVQLEDELRQATRALVVLCGPEL